MFLYHSRRFLLSVLLVAIVAAGTLFALVSCSPSATGGQTPTPEAEEVVPIEGEPTEEADHEHSEGEADHEHDEENEHAESEQGHSAGRIPNDGAVVRIVSPADGAVFGAADEVLVEVETENFDLAAEGNHWHVYVDGASYGMIVGGDTDHALRNLEAGEHEISVYLSIGTHEELEEGDAVVIQVEQE
jgi:hypothetical protein